MKFKYYEVISYLVPGYLLYQTVLLLFTSLPKIDIIPGIAIAYLFGYILNALSSWAEPIIFWTWGGKPSSKLLSCENTKKVKFYEHKETIRYLHEECTVENPSLDQLFGTAMRHSDYTENERVKDFNASYAFSRVLLVTVIIISVIIGIEYYANYLTYVFSIPLIIIIWFRAKDRAYYYSREVLKVYLSSIQNRN